MECCRPSSPPGHFPPCVPPGHARKMTIMPGFLPFLTDTCDKQNRVQYHTFRTAGLAPADDCELSRAKRVGETQSVLFHRTSFLLLALPLLHLL